MEIGGRPYPSLDEGLRLRRGNKVSEKTIGLYDNMAS